jgi:protein arginine kinase activator
MLCQRCQKRDAQFHSSRIINNELIDVHLCSKCVEIHGNQEETKSIDDKLHSLLEVLLKADVYNGNSSSVLRCDICGTTFKELEKSGLAGCPKCYDLFSERILKDNNESYGTGSPNKKAGSTFLERLEKRLKTAVQNENFEEAAKLRDKIRVLEKEGFFGDS